MDFLDSELRFEAESLAGTIREEFRTIEAAGLRMPDLEKLNEKDMQIWETHHDEPRLQPGDTPNYSSDSPVRRRPWTIEDEDIIFQRFGHFRSAFIAYTP